MFVWRVDAISIPRFNSPTFVTNIKGNVIKKIVKLKIQISKFRISEQTYLSNVSILIIFLKIIFLYYMHSQ